MKHIVLVSLLIILVNVLPIAANQKIPIQPIDDGSSRNPTVMYIPLDERFTTRDAFINLAKVTPFEVLTPPMSLLSHMKESANLTKLDAWIEDTMQSGVDYVVISVELYLYGGLISSRCSNDSYDAIQKRVNSLVSYKFLYPNTKIFLATVIMRIPSYNEDVEEPWYWAYYGANLYTYSFYLDKYNMLGNSDDLDTANQAISTVPDNVVQEFLWRRDRNHNITVLLLDKQKQFAEKMGANLFESILITQDDNAEYGLNINEARELVAMVTADTDLSQKVKIYPGADEVGLTMLGAMSVDYTGKSPKFQVIYRDESTKDYIPNYEGQPMSETVQDQIAAAGGTITESEDDTDVYFLVNNFSTQTQVEAPYQPLSGSVTDYYVFNNYIYAAVQKKRVVGFADSKYSNGGDAFFVQYMQERHGAVNLSMDSFAYAGWNTDGNTLGTVVSNCIVLALFDSKIHAPHNTYFNSLRILEDYYYQAVVRQQLINYVYQVGDDINDLSNDLQFYRKFTYKILVQDYENIKAVYNLSWELLDVYFPWNRTFEIGFNELQYN